MKGMHGLVRQIDTAFGAAAQRLPTSRLALTGHVREENFELGVEQRHIPPAEHLRLEEQRRRRRQRWCAAQPCQDAL